MKIIFTLLIVLFSSVATAQKPNSETINCKFRHIRYPQNVELSANLWAMTLTEHMSCQGAIPYSQKTSPLQGTDKRTQFYMNTVSNKSNYFYQTRENIGNLTNARKPFIHFELETRDIVIRSQQLKNGNPAQQNLLIAVQVGVLLKATRKGDMDVVLLDTNNLSAPLVYFNFPKDAQLGTAPDIMPAGYATEAELQAAWRKYGKIAEQQWRDKIIEPFLRSVMFNFTETYIVFEEWETPKIYSDKNKKGGYEELVNAAEVFANTFVEIDNDFETGSKLKWYTQEYQRRFALSIETWKSFLDNVDFDISSKDGEYDADYRQKILLNYILGLIYTKQFDEAYKQIAYGFTQDIRNVTHAALESLARLNEQIRNEYTANAARMGWDK